MTDRRKQWLPHGNDEVSTIPRVSEPLTKRKRISNHSWWATCQETCNLLRYNAYLSPYIDDLLKDGHFDSGITLSQGPNGDWTTIWTDSNHSTKKQYEDIFDKRWLVVDGNDYMQYQTNERCHGDFSHGRLKKTAYHYFRFILMIRCFFKLPPRDGHWFHWIYSKRIRVPIERISS